MHYAARTHSEGIGCARWSATSFLRRACSSALIEAGSSRNSGPMAMAFFTAGRSPISSSQRFTFGNSSISIFRVAQLDFFLCRGRQRRQPKISRPGNVEDQLSQPTGRSNDADPAPRPRDTRPEQQPSRPPFAAGTLSNSAGSTSSTVASLAMISSPG